MSPAGFLAREICELCGSEHKQSLVSVSYQDRGMVDYLRSRYQARLPLDFVGGETFELVKCQECGFVWQRFVPNPEQMAILYEKIISAEESLKKKEQAPISLYSQYASEMGVIASLCGRNPHQVKVLDFGMGWGFWCLMAKAFGFKISGFEASNARKEYAQKNGIAVIDGDQIPKESYDFINAEQVFEHIREPLRTLQHLMKGLNQGGIIRVSVPNGKDIVKPLNPKTLWKVIHVVGPLEHINCFSPYSLRKLGILAGLENIDHLLPGLKPKLTKIGLYLKKNILIRGSCSYFRKTA